MPKPEPRLSYGLFDSPLGPICVAGDGGRVHLIGFSSERETKGPKADWTRDDALYAEPIRQLRAYFAGELTRFDLPLHFDGTAFQKRCWEELCSIPFGQTVTYGGLAAKIGRPTAFRAVGGANGANRLPIVVPCHRVIGSDQSLTGFGGGIEIKRFLLDHEARIASAKAT